MLSLVSFWGLSTPLGHHAFLSSSTGGVWPWLTLQKMNHSVFLNLLNKTLFLNVLGSEGHFYVFRVLNPEWQFDPKFWNISGFIVLYITVWNISMFKLLGSCSITYIFLLYFVWQITKFHIETMFLYFKGTIY